MRIIAGSAGSLPIKVPKDLARPTTDRVREALFSSLGDLVEGASVLDLYSGSGALGLEALSRGAGSAQFVESSAEACRVISDNLSKTNLHGAEIKQATVASFLSSLKKHSEFDLILADPPYAKDEHTASELSDLLNHVSLPESLSSSGLLILETLASSPLPECHLWKVVKEKKYGNTRVSYLSTVS